MKFRFVHAADLHLDSPFRGLSIRASDAPAVVKSIREATFRAFDNLVSLCIREEARFLLIAGDVYDAEEHSIRAVLRFRDGLLKLSRRGIPVFVVHGNHDPVDLAPFTPEYPPGIRVFGTEAPETAEVPLGAGLAATVTGMSHAGPRETRNLARSFAPTDPQAAFRIALLHCNVGSNTDHDPYAPCELGELTSAPFDYWALGHVHERRRLSEYPAVVYPGNSQSRRAGETGARGVFVVTADTESRRSETRFAAVDDVRRETTDVDIAGITTPDALDDALRAAADRAAAQAEGRGLVLRLRTVGSGPATEYLQRPEDRLALLERTRLAVGRDADPFLYIERLEDRSTSDIDREARAKSGDLAADVLRCAQALRHTEGGVPARAAEELKELFEHTRAGKILSLPEDDELEALLQEAEILCVRLLEGNTKG